MQTFLALVTYSISCLYCISYLAKIAENKTLSNRLLKTINGFSGIATSTLILVVTYDENIKFELLTNILILFCIIFIIFYNSFIFIKANDIFSILCGIILFLMGFTLIYVISVVFTNSQYIPFIAIGMGAFLSIFIILFKFFMRPKNANGIKLVSLLILYLAFVLGMAYMYAPIGTFLDVSKTQNDTIIFMMFTSLKNSYTFPEYTNIFSIDFAHIVQFFTCRIFDTLMLGVSINILHGIVSDSNA